MRTEDAENTESNVQMCKFVNVRMKRTPLSIREDSLHKTPAPEGPKLGSKPGENSNLALQGQHLSPHGPVRMLMNTEHPAPVLSCSDWLIPVH